MMANPTENTGISPRRRHRTDNVTVTCAEPGCGAQFTVPLNRWLRSRKKKFKCPKIHQKPAPAIQKTGSPAGAATAAPLSADQRYKVARAHGYASAEEYEAARQARMDGKPGVRGKPVAARE